MRKVRLAVFLAAGFLAASFLAPLVASASTSADLATTVTPAFQEKPGISNEFTFRAVVTNNGPNPASKASLSVSDYSGIKVGFSVSPTETCTTSGTTFTCAKLPVHGTMTAGISFRAFCLGHICSGALTATASSATPDPNTANNVATGEWEIMCPRNCS
jgi:Domain of unknown function DUF11